MLGLTVSELLFYGGIAVMAAAAVAVILSLAIFSVSGRSIRRRLEQEYGKPHR